MLEELSGQQRGNCLQKLFPYLGVSYIVSSVDVAVIYGILNVMNTCEILPAGVVFHLFCDVKANSQEDLRLISYSAPS